MFYYAGGCCQWGGILFRSASHPTPAHPGTLYGWDIVGVWGTL